MKRIFLAGVALLGLSAPAFAQGVNTVPQVGVNTANLRQPTYVANMNALVPAATATDFFCIQGASGKGIHIRRIRISGTAGTLVTTPIFIRRITGTLDTVTTPSTAITGPQKLLSTNPTSVATVIGFDSTSGNPTVAGTTALMTGQALTLNVSGTTAAPAQVLEFNYGTDVDAYAQGLDIAAGATTTEYCLNLGGVSVTSGKLYGTITWQEY